MLTWLTSGTLPAILITAGVAVFLVCCLGCQRCHCKNEDPIFRRHD